MYKILILFAFFILSCTKTNKEKAQPTVLAENCKFDLEKIDFKEDVSKLLAEKPFYFYEDEIDTTNTNWISDSFFKYRIQSYMAEAFDINLPIKDLGYLYKTREMDSLAVLENAYFGTLQILTNATKKPIAYYSESQLGTLQEKDLFIEKFKKKYGPTEYEFEVDNSFNQFSYEWLLKDRTIQIETSKGFSITASTDGTNTSGEYYRLDVLIIENKFKEAIYKAHILELPEKFNIRGKVDTTIVYTNLKELRLEKENIEKDDFLLNSYYKELITN